jgi:hypothetical protein
MPTLSLTHFEASLLFALVLSVALGITTKKTPPEQLRYGAKCFGYFMGALIGLGWLMRLGHG